MQFSKAVLASAFVALAAAQSDLPALVSSQLAAATQQVHGIESQLASISIPSFTFPTQIAPGLSAYIASISSEFRAAVTNPPLLSSLESEYAHLATDTAFQQSIAHLATQSTVGGANPTGSTSSHNAAPTAVKAGGALAAAGLAVVALL